MGELLTIFWSFLKIGAFTFGGGYAMIPLIEHEVVVRRRWLSEREFGDLLTIAQAAPGPISLNTAVFVGYTKPSGSLVAFGLSPAEADCSIRISLSRYNTKADIDALCTSLASGLSRLVRIKK